MIARLQGFIQRRGAGGLARLAAYPLTLLLTTPVRLAQTLWACRVLLKGHWRDYPHCQVHKALNYLFYWSNAWSLRRHGRRGVSPVVGTGEFDLRNWFFYPLPSLYAYWAGGVAAVIAAMGLWWASHAVWCAAVAWPWVVAVMAMTLISPTFYANAFCHQNYNVFGWVFVPAGLYTLMMGHWYAAAAVWYLAASGSPTVGVIGVMLAVGQAAGQATAWPLIAAAAAAVRLAQYLLPLVTSGGGFVGVLDTLKLIGATKQGVRYRRKDRGVSLNLLIYLVLYGQFIAVLFVRGHEWPWLMTAALALGVVNATWVRFADTQSMQMAWMSVAAAQAIPAADPWVLASYWLAVAPLPMLLNFPSMPGVFDVVPRLAPYSIEPLRQQMEAWLAPVQKGDRILMAFDDPGGAYDKLFDGQRVLRELPRYVATCRGAHLMPDWTAVSQLNYADAPPIWGRDPETAAANADHWKADFLLIYTLDSQPDPRWAALGWVQVGRFDWSQQRDALLGVAPYAGSPPVWWLLRRTPAGDEGRTAHE